MDKVRLDEEPNINQNNLKLAETTTIEFLMFVRIRLKEPVAKEPVY